MAIPTIERTPRSADIQPAPNKKTLGAWFERWALLIALVVLTVVCIIALPQFRNLSLFTTMVSAQSLVLLLALTATVVLRTGDFDLSVAQNMVVSAAVIVQLTHAGVPPLLAVVIALVIGMTVGLINAILVVKVGVDSFVATLGSFTALAGLAYLITGSKVVTGVPPVFVDL